MNAPDFVSSYCPLLIALNALQIVTVFDNTYCINSHVHLNCHNNHCFHHRGHASPHTDDYHTGISQLDSNVPQDNEVDSLTHRSGRDNCVHRHNGNDSECSGQKNIGTAHPEKLKAIESFSYLPI